MDNNRKAFFALLQAGLWERDVRLMPFEPLDFDALYKLADEQSVVGLLAAGWEHVVDRKVTKPEAVQFLKKVFSLESRNTEMNGFIERLTVKLKQAKIHAILVKGQGVAQCYERPLWRSSGDVDLLLDVDNYRNAKGFLSPLSECTTTEDVDKKHVGMTLDSWIVELHGTLHSGLSRRVDKVIDEIQEDSLRGGNVRVWRNGEMDILLPGINNDVILIFTHILQHFFHGGIGLRQICDWSRLIWTYRDSLYIDLLESRLRRMGLMSEWKTFAAVAVDYLGHPSVAMPFYNESVYYRRKSDQVLSIVLKKGNFGQNDDSASSTKKNVLYRKLITIWRQLKESVVFLKVFPMDAMRFLGFFFVEGFQRTRNTTKF